MKTCFGHALSITGKDHQKISKIVKFNFIQLQNCGIIMMILLIVFINMIVCYVEYCLQLNISPKETSMIDCLLFEWIYEMFNVLLVTTDNTTQINDEYVTIDMFDAVFDIGINITIFIHYT